MSGTHLTITTAEEPRLRQAMGDIQETVAAYYADTARGRDLGGHARTWLARVQTLNDLLTTQLGDNTSYAAQFTPTPTAGAAAINAVKYARNVDQHLMHTVEPSEDIIIGGLHGLRKYACWRAIPPETHAHLRPSTQRLQPAYQANLEGQELAGTVLAALRFFAGIAPQIVHRDHRGEWTGFPLMNQPGVGAPLHPEEPVDDLAAANAWLNERKPNGDLRVVVGQVTKDGAVYLVGFTFADQLSFTPFVETPEQVEKDLAAGFDYLQGDVAANVDVVTDRFAPTQGQVFHSRDDVASWATPLFQTRYDEDWLASFSQESWDGVITLEHPGALPDHVAYPLRRSRRLNACVPPR